MYNTFLNSKAKMKFFLETHNGECGLIGHFCDQQRDHGLSILIQSTGLIQNQAEPKPKPRRRKLTRRVHSPN